MPLVDWDECDQKGEMFCDKGVLAPAMRADYPHGVELTLWPGGLFIGLCLINPPPDPGEEGPPLPFSVPALAALFAEGDEAIANHVPNVSFHGREEPVRVRRR